MAASIQKQFFNACRKGDTQEALRLLRKTGERADCKASDNYGDTALMLSAWHGNAETLRVLLPYSDPKAVNNSGGDTALILAAFRGNADCVNALLPVSDPLATDDEGHTAMMSAGNQGHVEIAAHIKQYILAQDEKVELSHGEQSDTPIPMPVAPRRSGGMRL